MDTSAAASYPGNAPLPPQNLEAEEYVLGSMMLSAHAIETVSDIIDAGDFYRESHSKIYRAALDLFQHGHPVDAITLADKLDENSELEEVGGKERIREIATLVPATSNAGHHAKIVREMATLRGLTVVGEGIQRLGWERPGETPELVDRAEQMVFDLAQHRIRGTFEHIELLVRESFEQITKMYESGGEMTGTPTGFRDVDTLTSGLQPGNLVVVAGRPSMGKSAFAMGIASNLALHHGIPVAIFTLEMSKIEVAQRLMCAEGRVELQRLRTGRLSNDDWPRLVKACDALTKAPIYVDDTRLTTMLEIRGKARRLKSLEPNLGLVMIDYLQLMASGVELREPRPGGLPDLALAEGARRRPRGSGARALTALPRRREPYRQTARALGSSRKRLHRAGQRPGDVPLQRRVLQRELRGSGTRGGDPRQAPQRPDRNGEARIPQAVREVLRSRAEPRCSGRGRMSQARTRQDTVWVAPSATQFSCLCERCLDSVRARGSSFLDAVRVASVRGTVPADTDIAFVRCRAGHELVLRRIDRPPNLQRRDRRQFQIA